MKYVKHVGEHKRNNCKKKKCCFMECNFSVKHLAYLNTGIRTVCIWLQVKNSFELGDSVNEPHPVIWAA